MLPKIGLVTDTDNWAFANIANQLKKNLSAKYDFNIIPYDHVNNILQIVLMLQNCELIHFFWRGNALLLTQDYLEPILKPFGIDYAGFYQQYLSSKLISTAIYDHLYLDSWGQQFIAPIFKSLVTDYYVCSDKLRDIYLKLDGYPEPLATLEDGVDLTMFYPINLNRFTALKGREIIIGWAGNSKWGDPNDDAKGFHSILKPAIEELQKEGYKIKSFNADRNEFHLPHEQMVAYYAKLDLYVCPSKIEGTPNPILEAMACGVPVISTDVGIVRQAFGNLQTDFILQDRSVECLKEKIKLLIKQPELFIKLSQENIQVIKSWDWKIKSEKFSQYFSQLLQKASNK